MNLALFFDMIDLETGRRRQIGNMLKPFGIKGTKHTLLITSSLPWVGTHLGYPASAGENLLFYDAQGSLWGWNPEEQKLVVLIPGEAQR